MEPSVESIGSNVMAIILLTLLSFAFKLKQRLEGKRTSINLPEILKQVPKIAENTILFMLAAFAVAIGYMALSLTTSMPDGTMVQVPAKFLVLTNSLLLLMMSLFFLIALRAYVR